MIYTADKIKHYQLAYKFGYYGSIFGFLLIAIILAPGKELADALRPGHRCEWNDYRAGIAGAWDGMLRKQRKY